MELVKYNAACLALAEAKFVDEVKDIRDKAEAMRAYARQAQNRQLEIDAAEIRFRAERRLGEVIKQQKETVGLNKGAAGGGVKDSPRGNFTEPRDTTPTLAEVGISKKLSSHAQKIAALPEAKFEEIVGDWRNSLEEANVRVTTNLLNMARIEEKRDNLSAEIEKYATKHKEKESVLANLILADPPWKYDFSETTTRAIENQYPTATVAEIKEHKPETQEDCVLLLWATVAKLPEALSIMSYWGFTYKTSAVWDKEKIGMGYWFRGQHELLLVGTKGSVSPPDINNRVSSVFREARGKHSKKPDCVYQWIESAFKDKEKLEMYCREPRDGWSVWGNQV